MNLAAVLSVVAAAIEAVMAVWAFVFARAPGWQHLRVFATVAGSACAYSALNLAFSLDDTPDAVIIWALRLNYLAACAHCAAWVVYGRIQYGEAVRVGDRALMIALGVLALLGQVPGLLTTDTIAAQTVAWADVTYHVPVPTRLGSVLIGLPPLALLVPLLGYARKAQRQVPGARSHQVAFCVLFLLAVNEAMVTSGALENLYLADVGFLIVVLSVLSEMANRVTTDARQLVALSKDLSRQVEERTRELVAAREGLLRAERLSALGRLSASVGHEINNPLSYVIGNLEYALAELERPDTSKRVLDALGDARGGAERIGRIVKELRVFGRGAPEPQRELTDPSDALESALRLAGNEIRCRARLVRELEPLPMVLADATRLTQVFVNLLLNAAQAIPEERSGTDAAVITVRARTLPEGRSAIEVIDTGIGISEQDQRLLFEPFFTTKPQDQGTGLGLFVSLGIITSFDGDIEIQSTLGRGTTVRVVLPPAPSDAAAERVPARRPLVVASNWRILVIDDDVLVARTIVRLLKGHQVETATSGQAALRRLLQDAPAFDLVLCDLMMPDMTGMELFETIELSRPALAERFVFISGGGVNERSRQFIESHRERVLPKPIDTRAISRVLAHHARQDGASR
jgi:signal transduction histidine kinase/CheY-like chemotaxis protein